MAYYDDYSYLKSTPLFRQFIHEGAIKVLCVPRNDHTHPDDKTQHTYNEQVKAVFDEKETKALISGIKGITERFQQYITRGGLESSEQHIRRLASLLRTLYALESVDDEQIDKVEHALAAAVKEWRTHRVEQE